MKNKISPVQTFYRVACLLLGVTALAVGTNQAAAQSIGCNIVNGGSGGIDNSPTDALLPAEVAGLATYAQSNWNNLSGYGSGTIMLTNSLGTPLPFDMQWDQGYTDSTGSGAGLGTPDGKLMDGFSISWGPGDASPLGTSVYGSSISDKPLVFIKGLKSWYTGIAGAEGYRIVLYTTGNSYYETSEGYVESVTGSPLDNSMVQGSSISPHLFNQVTGPYNGTYKEVTSTNLGSPTGGGNYMLFSGFTNDSVLLRLQCHGYGAGINGFQFVPIFASAPTPGLPVITPSAEVYAGVPVTITETATGDPFNPHMTYQWYTDNASGGAVSSPISNATNAVLSVTPTNNASQYAVQYLVVVANSFGSSTSSVVTLTVDPAVAPIVTQDTTPGAGNGLATVYSYVGGSVSFTGAFGGTPGVYQWQSNLVDIPGATTTTLKLSNLTLAATASYNLTDTNSIGGASTTPASLVVLADPAAPDSSTAYPNDVFTNGPVAYWRFSETLDNAGNSVQAYDYSGHNHNATYGVGAFDNQPGVQGLAGFESTNAGVAFLNNQANSFLIAPDLNLNTNTVTVTAWINPSTAVGNYWGLFTWNNTNQDKAGFGFGGNSTGGVAELGYTWNSNSPSTYNFHSALYPPLSQWSFVTLVITPTNSTIYLYYIDAGTGVTNLSKAVQTINNRSEAFSGGTIRIGTDDSAGRVFNGSMDEVAVFNKSLSEAQVQDLFLKGIGAAGVAPHVTDATVYPTATVYSGQNVRVSASVTGTLPLSLQWQSSADNASWTDIPGATASSVVVNPLVVGTRYYHLTAHNPISNATNSSAAVNFTALPATPAGLWTVNYQVTNNVLNYSTGAGIGYYSGRGILGAGGYWNVLPDNAGAFGYISTLTSVSDLRDDGGTHSGIYCSVVGGSSGFGSSTAVQPDSSDIGNLLYQWVTVYSTNNSLQFHGLPDGTYNVCFYGCDGYFNDRGTTFVAHDSLNGDQTGSTINASPILPLQSGVNFVLMTNIHASGGTLNVDIKPTTPVPSHDPNGEADFNGVQLQLVSYDVPAPSVVLNRSVTDNGSGGSNITLTWSQGILQTSTNALGPWTSIYSPSPLTLPVTKTVPAQFFRVKVE